MGVKRNSDRKTAQIRLQNGSRRSVLLVAAIIVLCLYYSSIHAQPINSVNDRPLIVIDPGHGGRDPGARGPSGTMEKDVCLALARELATHLEAARFEVLLTRSDDYDVELLNRTAIANHAKAGLFISIHTAASFVHAAQGMIILHQQPFERERYQADETDRLWQEPAAGLSARNRAAAQALARALGSGSAAPDITQAPLVVLAGAQMPAILIEAGFLTHAASEKKLSSPQYLTTLAAAMTRGITDYFAGEPPAAR